MNPPVSEADAPRLSVVIPTYQRRRLVEGCLQALAEQEGSEPFEVIVVVDGSTDATADALRRRRWPFPLSVLEQPNRGQAEARNRGASAVTSDIILFLDDDMELAPTAIAAHLDGHAAGADVVIGAMLLHPGSPRNLLSEEVARWGAEHAARCSSPGYRVGADDIFTGHLSLSRAVFRALGGFDLRFTAGGAFGNEDVDLSQRIVNGGFHVTYRPDAVAHQRFVVTAREHLRRWEQVGRADVALAEVHEDLDPSLRAAALDTRPRYVVARLARAAPRLTAVLLSPLRPVVCGLVDRGAHDPITTRVFWRLHEAAYWSGVTRARASSDVPPC